MKFFFVRCVAYGLRRCNIKKIIFLVLVIFSCWFIYILHYVFGYFPFPNNFDLLKDIGASQNISIKNIICDKHMLDPNPFYYEEIFQKKHYLNLNFAGFQESRKHLYYELSLNKYYQDLNVLKFCTNIMKKQYFAKSSNSLKSDILYKRVLDNSDLNDLGVNSLTIGGSYEPPYCIQEFLKYHKNDFQEEYANTLEMIEKQLSNYSKNHRTNKSILDLTKRISQLVEIPRQKDDLRSFIESRNEVTILIIPFLRREDNLRDLLLNMHGFLQRQRIQYRILVAEQINSNEKFNKGRLYNAAFKFAQELYDSQTNFSKSKYTEFNHNRDGVPLKISCIIMHDVDLIPESDYNLYKCQETPRHLSRSIRHLKNKQSTYERSPYDLLIGGVLLFRPSVYSLINGFSNEYWNWGAEDDGLLLDTLLNN